MKIKVRKMDYEKVLALPAQRHKKPGKSNLLFRLAIRIASIPDLLLTGFTYETIGMKQLGKKEPCLILMNHSSFLDLKIASKMLFPRPYHIVCT